MCIVASSYRQACKAWATGGGAMGMAAGMDDAGLGAVPSSGVISGPGGGKASSAVEYRDGPSGAAEASVLVEEDDEDDGDLGRPAARV